uniref:Uncharacterized protein n=1 Tax=Photinus pyralis TaxID=7054 RepID=A0A1Y1MBB3_PHOPY
MVGSGAFLNTGGNEKTGRPLLLLVFRGDTRTCAFFYAKLRTVGPTCLVDDAVGHLIKNCAETSSPKLCEKFNTCSDYGKSFVELKKESSVVQRGLLLRFSSIKS